MFKQVFISGNPTERGIAHGETLKEEIQYTWEFYRSIFNLSNEDITGLAAHFREQIESFNTDYLDEIRGIAKGSGLDELKIVALNSRTEILSHGHTGASNECSAVCLPRRRLLGQTWDWAEALESVVTVMTISGQNGHRITMFTEPGMIGKIGMNNSGVGVCLNILTLGKKLTDGVPIHILIRSILDCHDATEARMKCQLNFNGKSSNIMVADKNGECFSMEFAGDQKFVLEADDGYLLHTNHYLGEPINAPEDGDFASSHARYNVARTFLSKKRCNTAKDLCKLFADRSNPDLPIYRDYRPDPVINYCGTVSSVVMDLRNGEMMIRQGNKEGAEFESLHIG